MTKYTIVASVRTDVPIVRGYDIRSSLFIFYLNN